MDIAIVVLAGMLTGEVYPSNRCLECRKKMRGSNSKDEAFKNRSIIATYIEAQN